MNIDQIGEFLEHQGLSDEAIDEYFVHAGVPGMKWGVRKQQRLANKSIKLTAKLADLDRKSDRVTQRRERLMVAIPKVKRNLKIVGGVIGTAAAAAGALFAKTLLASTGQKPASVAKEDK